VEDNDATGVFRHTFEHHPYSVSEGILVQLLLSVQGARKIRNQFVQAQPCTKQDRLLSGSLAVWGLTAAADLHITPLTHSHC
jgi:hypothetical protein